MKPKTIRLFISPKDIQVLLNFAHYENARELHQRIRTDLSTDQSNPKRHLTIEEFCKHQNLPYATIFEALVKLDKEIASGARKIKTRVFITPKEVQQILGYKDYVTARKLHQAIRDGLAEENGLPKKRLTIAEFCKSMDLPFEAIYLELEKMNLPGDSEPQ